MLGLVGTCLFVFAWTIISLVILLRFLPNILSFLLRIVRGTLILSFRLYRAILSYFAFPLQSNLHVDVLNGLPRVVATVGLSLSLGVPLFLLTNWTATGLAIVLCILHGLLVGLAWDEIQAPGGLQLGSKIE